MFKTHCNNTYLKLLLSVAFVLGSATFLFSVLLSGMIRYYNESQLKDIYIEKTNYTADSIDAAIEKTKDALLTLYSQQDVRRWLYDTTNNKIIAQNAMRAIVNQQILYPYILQIYLIKEQTGAVLSSNEGTLSLQDIESQLPLEAFSQVSSNNLDISTISLNDEQNVLCLSFPVSLHKSNKGWLIFLLDKAIIWDILKKTDTKMSTEFILLDETGRKVLQSADFPNLSQTQSKEYFAFDEHLSENDYFVTSALIPSANWSLKYIIPIRQFTSSIRFLLLQIILLIVSIILLIAVLLLVKLKKTFAPFYHLAQDIQRRTEGLMPMRDPILDSNGDFFCVEHIIINSGFNALLNHLKRLDVSIENYQRVIRTGMLNKWILTGILSDDIREVLDKHSNLFHYERIQMLVLKVWSRIPEEKIEAETAVQNFVESLFSLMEADAHKEGLAFLYGNMGQNIYVILLGVEQQVEYHPLEIIKSFHNKLTEEKTIRIVGTLSTSFSIQSDVRNIYDRLCAMNMMRSAHEEQSLYIEEELIEVFPLDLPQLDIDSFSLRIREMIYAKKWELIEDLLVKIEQDFQKLPYIECKYYVLVFIHKTFQILPHQENSYSFGEIEKKIAQYSTLHEIIQWFYSELSKIAMNFHQENGKKNKIASQIRIYIKENLANPGLSIEQIADNFNFSTGYVRTIFKEIYQVSISHYILEERVKQSCQLLKTTNWTTLKIMESVGFQTQSNFFTSFKKITGLTPKQYRSQHKKCQSESV